MTNQARFVLLISGQGINGSSYGSVIVYGYGTGSSARYHYQVFGNFSVTIGADNTKQFKISCNSGQGIACSVIELISTDNAFSITTQ